MDPSAEQRLRLRIFINAFGQVRIPLHANFFVGPPPRTGQPIQQRIPSSDSTLGQQAVTLHLSLRVRNEARVRTKCRLPSFRLLAPMNLHLAHEHDWDVSTGEAKTIQERLAAEVRFEGVTAGVVETVAGVDVSIRDDMAQAAVCVLSVPDLDPIDRAIHRQEVPFPYIPGLLSFRETPPVLRALEQLDVQPDVLMTDSHGLAHPRRFGFACHLGVLLDRPALGVAKSILVGKPRGTLDLEKGDRVPLEDRSSDPPEQIGAVVRTRTDVNPVYVSVGHRISLAEAVDLTLRCSPRYKIPEPTRHAHRLSRE